MEQAIAVLVIDDDHDILAVATLMLKRQGYEVHGFNDPEKALDHTKVCKECSIIVSDIRMPVMNGFQLVRAVKKLRPDMKVVLMTAFDINKIEWQKTLPSTEVDQFITKPFRMSELIEVVENCAPIAH